MKYGRFTLPIMMGSFMHGGTSNLFGYLSKCETEKERLLPYKATDESNYPKGDCQICGKKKVKNGFRCIDHLNT